MTRMGSATPKRETDKALLVFVDDLDDEIWIPKSAIHDDSECYSMKGGAGDLVVEDWWAEKEGYAE